MTKPLNKNHLDFIRLVANGSTQSDAYKATIGNKATTDVTCRTKGSKLAAKYRKNIDTLIQNNSAIVDKANEKAILKTEEMNILSNAGRMEILSKMARGEIKLTKYIVCDGEIQERDIVPDYSDRRAAIAELNKMDGSYAPEKRIVTDGSPDLSKFSDEDLKRIAKSTS